MKGKKLQLFFMALSILFITDCEYSVDVAPDANEYASIVTEYDWMDGLNLQDVSKDIFKYVKYAFTDVKMVSWFYDDSDRIPAFSQFDPSYQYFPDIDERLRAYADEYDSDSLYWHLLSVDMFEPNQGGGALTYGRAADLDMGVNEPPTPVSERYSMIFTEDIINDLTEYGLEEDIPKALVFTVVHELGHQRAGLTHPNQYLQHHDPDFSCAMDPNVLITLSPKFCKVTNPDYYWQESNCLENIEGNYGTFE